MTDQNHTAEPGFVLEREPDDVPTPLAIAAADFCRRAGRPSKPEAVRLALARLRPDEDEALKELVDGEPPARPLGPESLVDLLRGLAPAEAARREETGYYVALALAPRSKPAPRAPAVRPPEELADRRSQQREELLTALAEARGNHAKAALRLGLSEAELEARIKRLSLVRRVKEVEAEAQKGARPPAVRKAGEKPVRERPSAPVPPPLPKRGAGRPPKGRMMLGQAALRDPAELEKPEGKEELTHLVETYRGNRRQILERLNALYRRPKGALGEPDLDRLLAKHHLARKADEAERDNLRILFGTAKGDLSQVAEKMRLEPEALRKELESRDLWEGVERVRDRFRRELFSKNVSEQVLLLLKRARYLRDLGAEDKLEEVVRQRVQPAWEAARLEPANERRRKLGERLTISDELAQGLIQRFGLK